MKSSTPSCTLAPELKPFASVTLPIVLSVTFVSPESAADGVANASEGVGLRRNHPNCPSNCPSYAGTGEPAENEVVPSNSERCDSSTWLRSYEEDTLTPAGST